ncbi:hypothetical protein Y032_0037g3391 [Ancylostoma ceylanicum]|uniref:Uncharacterized protein n=1 Tax=Ancylostoma ceylanicum TaxID=53326 RepID=A0A016UJX9_9BILA|nr:hypothetical protein Y032_0037g3391 [Ancylostoma ceylanicum]
MKTGILKRWRIKECGEHGTPSEPSWDIGYSSQDVIDPDINLWIDFIGFLSSARIQIEVCPLGQSITLITEMTTILSDMFIDLLIFLIFANFARGLEEACPEGLSTTLIAYITTILHI